MKLIGNIIWLIFGGLIVSFLYIFAGFLFCITIIGIPFGWQLMKIGTYALLPFGKDMTFAPGEPGCLSLIGNVIWVLCGWWEIALVHAFFGLLFCITIVGIPLGVQHFKIAKNSLIPFGQKVIDF